MTIEDIKRLNHILYTSYRTEVKSPHCLLVCYLLFFMRLLASIVARGYHIRLIKKRILFMAPSLNNKKSIGTIRRYFTNDEYEFWGNLKCDLPKARIYIKSVHYLPLFQKLYNISSDEDKALMRWFYAKFMTTCGFFMVIDEILSKSNAVELIIMANDHNLESRCVIESSERNNIKTLYIQHASITESFPPLSFSYSFLDGMESYKKYNRIGKMKGIIFLTGSPRFDEIYSFKSTTKIYDIGIALNMLDSCDKAMELCRYLQNHFSTKIIIRPHPRMGNLFNAQLFKKQGLIISDSIQESSFSFLSKIKFLIANESSIHLDSALMGVPSLLYNFSDSSILDWYYYIKNGLIKVANSKEDVVAKLKYDNSPSESNIRFYNAAFHTQMEGKVGEFIASFIKAELDIPSKGLAFMKRKMFYVDGHYEYNV